MDLYRIGGDRRKKELDGEQDSSTSTKFSKSCEVCGLTIFSAALPSDETLIDVNKLQKVCQCFFQPSVVMPAVDCPNNPQQDSHFHQQTIQFYKRANYPEGLPDIPPSCYYTSIPAIVYPPFAGNLPVQSFPPAFHYVRHTGTIPLYHMELGNRSPFIETREHKPPEESIKSSTKVSDWINKQCFLSHTTDQEKSPSPPSSTSQTSSDEKQFSQFPSHQDEEKGIRKSSFIHGSSTASGYLKIQNFDEENQGLGRGIGIKYNRAPTLVRNRILDNRNENFENRILGWTHLASRSPKILRELGKDPSLIGLEENKHNLHRRGSPKSQNPFKLGNEQSHTDLKKGDQSLNVEKQVSSRQKNFKPKKKFG